MKKQVKHVLQIAVVLFLLLPGCQKHDSNLPASVQSDMGNAADYNAELRGTPTAKTSAEVPLAWYNLAITLVRFVPVQGTGPISARLYGYVGLALYESVVPGMPMHQSLQSQLNRLPPLPQVDATKKYYYPACANAALASMLHYMLGNASAEQHNSIDSLEQVFNATFQSMVPQEVLDRSVHFGKDISEAIYNWSATDGGDKAYLNPFPPYTPPVGPGLWVPLAGQIALLPYWGNNRTFITHNATSTQPPPPIPYSTNPKSEYYREELQVYKESINQDPEHRDIAFYWGGSISGTSVSIDIVSNILKSKSSNLATAAEAYCKAGIAISDAVVSDWKTKFKYNQERPTTYIRANLDTGWSSLLPTPPYPDYSSGYTIQASACMTVLADMFGNNTTFTSDYVNSLGFGPRIYHKFSDCIVEIAHSRFYAGIHIPSSNYIAIPQGALVGAHVNALHFLKSPK